VHCELHKFLHQLFPRELQVHESALQGHCAPGCQAVLPERLRFHRHGTQEEEARACALQLWHEQVCFDRAGLLDDEQGHGESHAFTLLAAVLHRHWRSAQFTGIAPPSRFKFLHSSTLHLAACTAPHHLLLLVLCTLTQTLIDALSFVRAKRPQCSPNAGFMQQLQALELELFGRTSLDLDKYLLDRFAAIDALRTTTHDAPATAAASLLLPLPAFAASNNTSSSSSSSSTTAAAVLASKRQCASFDCSVLSNSPEFFTRSPTFGRRVFKHARGRPARRSVATAAAAAAAYELCTSSDDSSSDDDELLSSSRSSSSRSTTPSSTRAAAVAFGHQPGTPRICDAQQLCSSPYPHFSKHRAQRPCLWAE
jgi:hypothetical protein